MSEATQQVLRKVLVIGGESDGARCGRASLECIAGEVLTARGASTAAGQARGPAPDLILIWEEQGALEALGEAAEAFPGTASVVVTARASPDSARRFLDAGAVDYIETPLEGDRLDRLLATAGRGADVEGQSDRFFCPHCPPGVHFVGRSEGVTRALELLQVISYSHCNPVLILGETGTGKELAARGVHTWRSRQDDRFVAVNCAALTANLLESELFGHVKGAFTGADRDKIGLFEAAGHGTLFLDEISEMPLELQAKLLRVLQESTFRRVGGTRDLPNHAGVIASSNRDLLAEAHAGRFRKDLYYRLAVFPVTIPPLRAENRRSDISLLAEYLLRTSTIPRREVVKGLSTEARRKLLDHDWPGNVRELRNVIDRALIIEKTDRIRASSILIDSEPAPGGGEAKPDPAQDFSLETAEREFILRALKETGWQRTRAAALLGITRATLYAKLKRYCIEAPGQGTQPGA